MDGGVVMMIDQRARMPHTFELFSAEHDQRRGRHSAIRKTWSCAARPP